MTTKLETQQKQQQFESNVRQVYGMMTMTATAMRYVLTQARNQGLSWGQVARSIARSAR